MFDHKRVCRWLSVVFIFIPLFTFAATPIKSIVIFGDSLSDNGNTTHLLKSLRQEEDPAFIVAPFKAFVLNKMVEYANDYYVPQIILDAGISVVTEFFDHELAPYITNLIAKVKLVPLLPGQPYWESRFSNGKVWNEYLADMLAIQKSNKEVYTNKAFGGGWAATYDYQLSVWNLIRHPIGTIKTLIVGKLIPPSMGLTIQAYLLEHQSLNPESVYFVFGGSNDYINVLLFEDNYNTTIMSAYIDNVIDALGSTLKKLAAAGGKRFVVMGIPRIGETPRFVNTSDRDVLNNAAQLHNERLQARIAQLKTLYPTVDFLYVDIDSFLTKALVNPDQYGFTNVKEACIDVKFPMFNALAYSPFAGNFVMQYAQVLQYKDPSFGPNDTNYHVCDTPQNYLFWDEIHPSTRAHGLLAVEICNAMKDHGYDITCNAPSTVQ